MIDSRSIETKIAVIPDNIGSMGGTRSFLFKLLSFNKKNNLSTTLAIQSNQFDEHLLDYCILNNVNIFLLPSRKQLFYKPYFSLLYDIYIYFLLNKTVQPNIILTSIGTPRLLLGLFLFRIPLIYYVHTYPSRLSWKSKYMDLITKYFSGSKKRIVTVSEYSKNKISKYMSVDRNYIDVIYNSVEYTIKETDPQKKNDIVLTVGHVEEYKNPNLWYLVAKKVIDKHPSCMFCWVGDGTMLEEMRKRVIADHLERNIIFSGLHENVTSFYLSAKIYFQPSLIESHGISIVEAMSYALPCVGSKIGGIPESIDDGKSGFLVDVNDVDAFSEKICYLLENTSSAQEMGKKGQKIAKNKFNESIQEKSVLNIYNKVIKD